jgi:stage II sporulation protein D
MGMRFADRLTPCLFLLKQLVRLGNHSWWLSLLFGLMAIAPAYAESELEMRVAIEREVSQIKVGSSTSAVIKDGAGQVLAELPAMAAMNAETDAGRIIINQWQAGLVWVEPTQDGLVWIGDNWYRGRTLLIPDGNGLTAVNYVDLEHYLYSVVGGEMPTNWHPEALKAQAIAARSYALYRRETNRSNAFFDVGDTTAWQVYDGVKEEASSTIAAVEATKGQVLTYGGRIIEAVFHASSGGCTENVENVWTQPLPYLRGVPDPYDQGGPWTAMFPAEDLKRRISGIGNIVRFEAEQINPACGRILSMRVVGDEGVRILDGDELRTVLGLRSTVFNVEPQMSRIASASSVPAGPIGFLISGRGYGHGLGMSQWGAYGLAQRGYNYQQIVAYYYTGAALARIEVQ